MAGGVFFFTVALADRRSSALTDHIHSLRRAYRRAMDTFPFETIAICVLPDHLHAIWQMPADDADFSTRWSRIKASFARGLPAARQRSPSKVAKREKGIWQRRFWEHQIRDEDDLERHVEYIHFNPVKHGVVERVADWPFSSFHRYVQRGWLQLDWGGAVVDGDGFGER